MAAHLGTLEQIARALGKTLGRAAYQLSYVGAPAWMARFGVVLPPAFFDNPAFSGPREATAALALELSLAVDDLVAAPDAAQLAAKGIAVLDKMSAMFRSLTDLQNGIAAAAAAVPGIPPARIADIVDDFPRKALGAMLAEQCDIVPAAGELLTLLGVLERIDVTADPDNPALIDGEAARFRFDQLGPALRDPIGRLRSLYDWGAPGFDGSKLFPALAMLLTRSGVPSLAWPPQGGLPAKLDAFAFELSAGGAPGEIEAIAATGADGTLDMNVPALAPEWALRLQSSLMFPPGTKASLKPPFSLSLVPPGGAVSGSVSLSGGATPPEPYLLFGVAGASRLEVGALRLTADLGVTVDTATGSATALPRAAMKFTGGRLVVDTSGADGFLQQLLSGFGVDAAFELDLGFDAASGLHLQGSSALEIALPVHVELGPASVNRVYIVADPGGSPIPIELSVALTAELGPLSVMADHLGVAASIGFPAAGGNLGPVQLDVGFKPPGGVGLSLDVGIAKGGGFLDFFPATQEYAGGLELDFAGIVTVKAVGLVTTRMPDGSPGFSLLIILTAEFGSGIQLGFGFTLLAVGGLFGLNRSVQFEALMDGLRTNAIENVLFPKDIVANAQQIVSDLRTLFPPQAGTFLVGPMAKVGWGEPTLISLSLGVILEIPRGDVAILGVLKAALPAEDLPILVLQVNFAGVLEFDKSRFYFYATLFDSHVLFLTIEGGMGLLMAFGQDANFVLSVGGFHPQFNPPPLPFPAPQRIEVDIINESFARIRCQGYFAVTTNTVQFGSHSEYFFGFDAFNIQGHSSFDGLIQFSPFHFSIHVSTDFSVKVFGIGVYGVGIDLLLEGPIPWHAHGTASLSFFLFSVDIGIDFTWGENRNATLPPVQLMPVIAGELGKQSNWQALLPDGSNLLVSLRPLAPAEAAMVLHPVGTLRVSQRAIPLDLTLDKAGSQAPADANRFGLTVGSSGLAPAGTPQELFPLGQFKNLDDATKLSQAAYSPMDSGVVLSAAGDSVASSTAITSKVRYDLRIIDTRLRRVSKRFFVFVGSLFNHFLLGSSVALSPLSAYARAQAQPYAGKVVVQPEHFAVVNAATNTVFHPDAAGFASHAAAQDFLSRTVSGNPSLEGSLQVIPGFEVAA